MIQGVHQWLLGVTLTAFAGGPGSWLQRAGNRRWWAWRAACC